ncbi:hypothetical protein BSAF29S_05970 [Bacillus safensis subsp. safensis]
MRITKKIYFTAFDSRYELSFLSTFQKNSRPITRLAINQSDSTDTNCLVVYSSVIHGIFVADVWENLKILSDVSLKAQDGNFFE